MVDHYRSSWRHGSPISFLPESQLNVIGFRKNLRPITTTIKGVSGHSLPVLGQIFGKVRRSERTRVRTRDLHSSSPKQARVLGLDGLRALQVNLVLSADASSQHPAEISKLLHLGGNLTGGMKVKPVHLDVGASPVFMKARSIRLFILKCHGCSY
jgi:hypothetical protein